MKSSQHTDISDNPSNLICCNSISDKRRKFIEILCIAWTMIRCSIILPKKCHKCKYAYFIKKKIYSYFYKDSFLKCSHSYGRIKSITYSY